MKIVFIGQKGIPAKSGGVERHVEFLSRYLQSKGHDVLAYNRRGYTPDKIKEYRGVKLIYKSFINNKNLASITHNFLATIDALRRRPDIIHYQGIGPSLLIFIPKILCPKAKIAATLHSFDYQNDKWSPFAKFMLRLGEKLMFAQADAIIVLTPSMEEYARKRFKGNIHLIPNGTNLNHVEGDRALKFWGLEKEDYILSVSRLIRLKGVQYLIKAFKGVNTDKKLVIAGDGEYEEELHKLAQGDKRIIFVGNQSGEDLFQLYKNSYLFIQSSEMEGLSMSLLEAMGQKTTCLASDIAGNREALADAGLYFKSKDVESLKVELENILKQTDKRDELAQAAYNRAKEKFDWSKIVEKTEELYKSLLETKK